MEEDFETGTFFRLLIKEKTQVERFTTTDDARKAGL